MDKKKVVEYWKFSESDFEFTKNESFIDIIKLLEDFFSEKNNTNIDYNKANN